MSLDQTLRTANQLSTALHQVGTGGHAGKIDINSSFYAGMNQEQRAQQRAKTLEFADKFAAMGRRAQQLKFEREQRVAEKRRQQLVKFEQERADARMSVIDSEVKRLTPMLSVIGASNAMRLIRTDFALSGEWREYAEMAIEEALEG